MKEETLKQKNYTLLREIYFSGIEGPITFIVSGDTEEYQLNIKKFDNTLSIILFILGTGLMIAVFFKEFGSSTE